MQSKERSEVAKLHEQVLAAASKRPRTFTCGVHSLVVGTDGFSRDCNTLRQVSAEIAERQQFMQQMRQMGKGHEHEQSMQLQITDRMQELGRLETMMRE